jgi:DNA-directed RNA polymerase sigma subunit (sigma70/sigma32)
MHRALDDGDRTIRLPVHLQENVRRIRSKRAKLALEIGREPTLPELANHIGVDKERRTVGQGTTSRCIWITAQFEGLRCAARWAAAA